MTTPATGWLTLFASQKAATRFTPQSRWYCQLRRIPAINASAMRISLVLRDNPPGDKQKQTSKEKHGQKDSLARGIANVDPQVVPEHTLRNCECKPPRNRDRFGRPRLPYNMRRRDHR